MVGENYCGECYGAQKPESGCCNTCEDVRKAYEASGWSFNHAENIEQCTREGYLDKIKEQANQGCRIRGKVTVNKVAGNFHVAPGRSFQRGNAHVHDIQQYLEQGLDFSHQIEHLSFGEKIPNVHNPLDDTKVENAEGLFMFQYYLKVVGTRYYYLDKEPVFTNQFSVTQYNRNLQYKNAWGQIQAPNGLPGKNYDILACELSPHPMSSFLNNAYPLLYCTLIGVFFNFDISPMLVIQKEERKSFASFLTGVCAIVGGIFTVAGLLDGAIWRAERTLKRKMELGKAF